ncbi:MAG: DUF4623 domain-containing protein [Planctomycetales bacterium]|nr:DUF4623 domain-containing protein [Planctomycetales bacterium]
MIRRMLLFFLVAALLVCNAQPGFALSLSPLTSFGGDGWLAPGELGFNAQTNATVRGITYNAASNHVYAVDRDGGLTIRVLDGDTGSQVGTLDATGITGGTFALNMIDVDDEGVIYAGNLSTSATSNFKIYRWENETSVPTVAFDGAANRTRTGDTFAVSGAGSSTVIVSAGGAGVEDYALFRTADGSNFAVENPVVTGDAPGAFRLGIDIDAGVVVGTQTGAALTAVAQAGGAADVHALNAASESIITWDANEGLLATVDFNSSDVRLYDASDLGLLTSSGFQDVANLTTSLVSNGNGVGDAKFGRGPAGALRLYALNANNGIQAFNVVPEPVTAGLGFALGTGLVTRRRRR